MGDFTCKTGDLVVSFTSHRNRTSCSRASHELPVIRHKHPASLQRKPLDSKNHQPTKHVSECINLIKLMDCDNPLKLLCIVPKLIINRGLEHCSLTSPWDSLHNKFYIKQNPTLFQQFPRLFLHYIVHIYAYIYVLLLFIIIICLKLSNMVLFQISNHFKLSLIIINNNDQ